jgi:hypothetical protein
MSIRDKIEGLANPETRCKLVQIADSVEASHGQHVMEFGSWHGDFVPWNLARLGKRLYAWDWESSAASAPLGFDAVHFYFQIAFVANRHLLGDAAVTAELKARPALDRLGVRPNRQRLVAALHLLELFVRHEEAYSSSGERDDRFYPEIERVLNRSLALSSKLGIPS